MWGKKKNDCELPDVVIEKMVYKTGDKPEYWELLELDKVKAYHSPHQAIVVGVLDNGVSPHEDLESSILGHENFTDENDGIYGDHGTHVSGTISSGKYGISKYMLENLGINIYDLKCLSGLTGMGSSHDIVEAVNFATDNDIRIINMSLGSSSKIRRLESALIRYIEKSPNNIAVIATGNDGGETNFPSSMAAKYSQIIAVGSGDIKGDNRAEISSFSSRGTVTVIAQGERVLSTTRNGYGYKTGTSMATPMVTALIALAKSIFREARIEEFNAWDFHKILSETRNGNPIATLDIGNDGTDTKTGAGYILPLQFLQSVTDMCDGKIERGEIQSLEKKSNFLTAFIAFINPLNW